MPPPLPCSCNQPTKTIFTNRWPFAIAVVSSKPAKKPGCPIFGAVSSRLRWECIHFPNQLLFLPLFLFLPLLVLFPPTLTNVISTEGGALCRRSGEIPVFRLCSCLCCYCCLCSCLCPCRCSCCCSFYLVILSAAKNPRISKGSEATRVPFSPTQPNIVISTGAAQALREPHSGEKPASLPTPPPNPNRRLPLRLLPIPTPCFPVKSPNPITQIQSTTSVWRSSFTQPAIMNTEIKKRAPAARGSFPLSQRNAASHLL